MGIEIGVKIKLNERSLEKVRTQVLALGARQLSKRCKEENFLFDFSDRHLQETGCVLRLRRYGQLLLLTYKGRAGADPLLEKREEWETTIGDFNSMRKTLEKLGLKVRFEYSKYREVFELKSEVGSTKVCIDETPMGCFVEIEGSEATIKELATCLGWTSDCFIRKDYVELYEDDPC